ncbi:MAG: cupin domain-containing protein [Lentisphaeria bacterium]
MHRKPDELRRETSCWNRREVGDFIHLAEASDLPGNVRFFAVGRLNPGETIGYHQHTGEKEVFYFLEGEGEVNDNGTTVHVRAGDVIITPLDGGHSFANTGNGVLAFVALILKDEVGGDR